MNTNAREFKKRRRRKRDGALLTDKQQKRLRFRAAPKKFAQKTKKFEVSTTEQAKVGGKIILLLIALVFPHYSSVSSFPLRRKILVLAFDFAKY